jgi:hypothetical protein
MLRGTDTDDSSLDGNTRRTEPSVGDDPRDRRGAYAMAMGAYLLLTVGAAAEMRRRRIRLPDISARDVILTAFATQRVSRVLARDPITSPLRAPFTDFVGVSGPAQLEERAVDDSRLRHTIGELITCPFCLGQWVGTGFVVGHVLWPRAARIVTAGFAAIGLADHLHHLEQRLRDT